MEMHLLTPEKITFVNWFEDLERKAISSDFQLFQQTNFSLEVLFHFQVCGYSDLELKVPVCRKTQCLSYGMVVFFILYNLTWIMKTKYLS